MAKWTLVPCLVTLRDEFNRLAPKRDKASDGSVGDTSHAANPSDHNPDETGTTPSEDADRKNEVHAIDVDDQLRKAGWSMDRCVEIIVTRHREGDDDRLQNVIYNRRIWSRSWGWTARPYTGASAHTEHAHFSARYTSAQEADTSPWGLLELEDDMTTKADFLSWLRDPAVRAELAAAVLNTDGVVRAPGNPPAGTGPDGKPVNTHWAAGSYLQSIYAASVSARGYAAAARDLAGRDDVDEQALVAALTAPLARAVAASLPASQPVTDEQLQAAILGALRELAAGAPA